ncbi:oxidoreductase C-terminal domain-containing protein [Streptomyces sp. NBC_01224]|uniref:oxidoreductase C-terminal domain-containing protein n=1 Tax=Streptomyces sp. NBC_01224 TaxID=2903783 RepID=UPI003FA3DBBD
MRPSITLLTGLEGPAPTTSSSRETRNRTAASSASGCGRDVLVTAAGMNRPKELRSARMLIERRIPVAAEALASPATDLRPLSKAPAACQPLGTAGAADSRTPAVTPDVPPQQNHFKTPCRELGVRRLHG